MSALESWEIVTEARRQREVDDSIARDRAIDDEIERIEADDFEIADVIKNIDPVNMARAYAAGVVKKAIADAISEWARENVDSRRDAA